MENKTQEVVGEGEKKEGRKTGGGWRRQWKKKARWKSGKRKEGQKVKKWDRKRTGSRNTGQKRMNRRNDGVVNNGWSVLRP